VLSVLNCHLRLQIPLNQLIKTFKVMLNWIIPVGWILLLFTGETATCQNTDGNIIIIDMNGV